MRIALFQPDIPQNTGNIIRLATCFNISIDIIHPVGFFLNDKKFKRSAMDYLKYASIKEHSDWDNFYKWSKNKDFRLVLLTTKATNDYCNYSYKKNDIIIFGRESAGVPDKIHTTVNERLIIQIDKRFRSLNLSSAAAIVISEAIRQFK